MIPWNLMPSLSKPEKESQYTSQPRALPAFSPDFPSAVPLASLFCSWFYASRQRSSTLWRKPGLTRSFLPSCFTKLPEVFPQNVSTLSNRRVALAQKSQQPAKMQEKTSFSSICRKDSGRFLAGQAWERSPDSITQPRTQPGKATRSR